MENPSNRSGLDAGGGNLRGRCALVPGAGSGIGRACAFRLAAARAEVVAFLRTPQASFITGTSITMDGGWTAR